jgi:adenylate cyclase class 2
MAQEIEAKILNVDVQKLEEKLLSFGAERKSEKLFRAMAFDYPGYPMDKEAAWVRLRDEGDKITMAYKKRLGVKDINKGTNDSGMEEIEVSVSDYDLAKEFLLKLGMVVKFYQEKKRITWQKGPVTYDIDTWPQLEPYLEVEGETWEIVDSAILELGYDLKDKIICSATQIYEMNGIRDKDYIKMTFAEFVKREL